MIVGSRVVGLAGVRAVPAPVPEPHQPLARRCPGPRPADRAVDLVRRPVRNAGVHPFEHLEDAVGGERRVDVGDGAGGQLGVEAVDQRLVRLPAADEPDAIGRGRTTSRPERRRPCRRALRPGWCASSNWASRRLVLSARSGLSASDCSGSSSLSRTMTPQKCCTSARCHSRSSASQSGTGRHPGAGVERPRAPRGSGRTRAEMGEEVQGHATTLGPSADSATDRALWQDGRHDLTTVHLLRHGEVHNPRRHPLRPPARLPPVRPGPGARRVAAAEFLATRDIGYLVASPLERAQETAAPLAELAGLPIGDRRAPDRGGERARGTPGRRRQGAVHRSGQLEVLPQPAPSELGRAVRADRRAGARRRARGPRPGRRQRPGRGLRRRTNCRSSRRGARPRDCACSTTRAGGSAPRRRSRRSPTTGTSSWPSTTPNRPRRCRPGTAREPSHNRPEPGARPQAR